MTFSSSSQIAFNAIRGFTNERSEFLITPLPLATTESAGASSLVIPNYIDGGPWQSRIILVNPANVPVSGVAEFFSSSADLEDRWTYTIPAASATSLQTTVPSDSRAGWIRITPDQNSVSPSAVTVLSFRSNGTTDYEFGVTAEAEESAFRIYAETSGIIPEADSIQSGFTVSNSATTPLVVHLEVLDADSTQTGVHRYLTIPPMSQITMFLDEIPEMPRTDAPFRGFLRLSGGLMSAIGLRKHYNERGQLLVTSLPAIGESVVIHQTSGLFPLSKTQPGYTTQVVDFDTD
jgi:hypothetical protein